MLKQSTSRSRLNIANVVLDKIGQVSHTCTELIVHDAKLTQLGKQQARELNDLTKGIQARAELLVCSPLLRPLETMVLGYPDLKARLGKVVIMDLLQEAMGYPCDTPTYPPSAIQSALGGIFADLDFSTLSEGYHTKQGIFDPKNVEQRAERVRKWLEEREEKEIVVVAHGDILRQIVDGPNSRRPWGNAEVKVFTFIEGKLVEVDKVEPKDETDQPTSSQM